eukprot:7552877-Lingulodinium_polyedra.AAC.1
MRRGRRPWRGGGGSGLAGSGHVLASRIGMRSRRACTPLHELASLAHSAWAARLVGIKMWSMAAREALGPCQVAWAPDHACSSWAEVSWRSAMHWPSLASRAPAS